MRPKSIPEIFANIRHLFESENLKPPVALILADHEEGMRFLSMMHGAMQFTYPSEDYGKPVEHPDGSVWMEACVQGIKVRWPANKWALESGGYVWA